VLKELDNDMKCSWMPRLLSGLAIVAAASLVACGGGKANSGDPKTGGDDNGSDMADTDGTADGASDGGDAAETGSGVGQKAPEITGEAVMGDGPKSLSEGAGQVVIVDFWGTFCEPCRKSFPKYQELVDKHAGNLAVIAVSVDDPDDVGADDLKKFAEETGVSFSIVWDKDKSVAGVYEPPKMPTSYIVDKDGIVRHVHAGFEGGEAEEIDAEVEALLQ